MNQDAKYQGFVKDVDGELVATSFVLALAHFPATLARVREEFVRQNVPHVCHERRPIAADHLHGVAGADDSPRAILALADALVPDSFPTPSDDGSPRLSIVVAERHFLRAHDDTIVDFAGSLGRRCRLCFHTSLQDPLMQHFAGAWVGQILRNLGMKDSDPIQSAMVGRRIQSSQATFARRVTNEQQASSAEEWLSLNVSAET